MIRTLFLVLAILAVAVMPNPAHGGGMTRFFTTHTPTTIRTPSTARQSSWSHHRWSISRRQFSVK